MAPVGRLPRFLKNWLPKARHFLTGRADNGPVEMCGQEDNITGQCNTTGHQRVMNSVGTVHLLYLRGPAWLESNWLAIPFDDDQIR